MFRLAPKTLGAKNGGVNMSNHPAPGNAALALRSAVGCPRRGVPEPGC
jgi:hypothetical protein